MDLKTLKLELLERIALLEDEARLLALKRLLDGPPTYAVPNDHLAVVKEGGADYLPKGQKLFTLDEVRAIVDAVKEEYEGCDLDDELSPEEIAELRRRDQEMDSGKVKGYTWEDVQAILDGDREKQRSGE
ncbi:MAG TPA: addiction module protein [Flavobacteriales bacterium]|nr:addiction module protein [Flavobacteriales bacterium]HMR26764.1 addiction module protein [Flavobacteriales bacterium]